MQFWIWGILANPPNASKLSAGTQLGKRFVCLPQHVTLNGDAQPEVSVNTEMELKPQT